MTGYYDYILGLIPLALLGITGALVVVGLSVSMAVPMAAGVAALITGHALFVNGPSSPSPSPGRVSPSGASERPGPTVLDAD
ncbi:hypothetical protein [Haloferax sp. DFSO60]|uniref:hypothetical protein n=1 Tax=Haloferax sp. DFSO60 TaxID=3388652 RepID=UPI00397ADE5F